jgi:hypothetical protein
MTAMVLIAAADFAPNLEPAVIAATQPTPSSLRATAMHLPRRSRPGRHHCLALSHHSDPNPHLRSPWDQPCPCRSRQWIHPPTSARPRVNTVCFPASAARRAGPESPLPSHSPLAQPSLLSHSPARACRWEGPSLHESAPAAVRRVRPLLRGAPGLASSG